VERVRSESAPSLVSPSGACNPSLSWRSSQLHLYGSERLGSCGLLFDQKHLVQGLRGQVAKSMYLPKEPIHRELCRMAHEVIREEMLVLGAPAARAHPARTVRVRTSCMRAAGR